MLYAWQNNMTGEFGLCFCLGLVCTELCSESNSLIFLVYGSRCPILFPFFGSNWEHKVNFQLSLDQRNDWNRSLLNKWMGLYEWVHKYRRGIFNKVESDWVTVLKIITKASTAPFASLHRETSPWHTHAHIQYIYCVYINTEREYTETHTHTHIWLISLTKQQHPNQSFSQALNEEVFQLAESAAN